MRAAIFVLVGLVAAVPGSAGPADAGQPFWCGSHRVRLGEHITEVYDRCGEPDFASQRVETRTYKRRIRGHHHRGDEVWEERTVEVLVDEWRYDPGPNRYVRTLRFENQVLLNIASRWVGSW